MLLSFSALFFFFFNDTATTEIYTLSLHDALPISTTTTSRPSRPGPSRPCRPTPGTSPSASSPEACRRTRWSASRSEEHTSELQSLAYLVCRLLLEKKKKKTIHAHRSDPISPTEQT